MDPPLCMWARVRIRLCPGREEEEDEEEEEEEEEERGGGRIAASETKTEKRAVDRKGEENGTSRWSGKRTLPSSPRPAPLGL